MMFLLMSGYFTLTHQTKVTITLVKRDFEVWDEIRATLMRGELSLAKANKFYGPYEENPIMMAMWEADLEAIKDLIGMGVNTDRLNRFHHYYGTYWDLDNETKVQVYC